MVDHLVTCVCPHDVHVKNARRLFVIMEEVVFGDWLERSPGTFRH